MALNQNNKVYDEKLDEVLEKFRGTSDSDSALSFIKDNHDNCNVLTKLPTTCTYSKAFIGQPAPYFEGTLVFDGIFKNASLTDYLGKYLILMFYPLDFTFVCPTEIIAFSNSLLKFRRLNTEVIACSTDSKFTHLAWLKTPREEGGISKVRLPLLSDITRKISKNYGVYSESLGHDYRGLFIIDHRGIIRQITINDLSVGRNADEILRLVQAFQFTDTHGEVCPAGWEPGDEAMIPDSDKSKKYFQKNLR